MSTLREARRALARGSIDEALVDLWNVLEPLRLQGDASGLEHVAGAAEAIVEVGDGSQVREAERLLEEVEELLAGQGAAGVEDLVEVGRADHAVLVSPEDVPPEHPADEPAGPSRDALSTDGEPEVEGRRRRSPIGSLVWALIIGGFVLFNVLRGIFGE